MSSTQTEVQTTAEAKLGPSSSASIRARSPQPPESFLVDQGSEPIQLAELGHRNSHGSKSQVDVAKNSATPSVASFFEQTSKSTRWKANLQFFTLCWTLFLAGWNDGTTGPLLPRIQSVYHVCVEELLRPYLCGWNSISAFIGRLRRCVIDLRLQLHRAWKP